MYFENNAPTPAHERLRALEASRVRLLETMFSLRCDCAEVFGDPRRSEDERDDAAWELAHAVGDIERCDEELYALRELAREPQVHPQERLIGSGSGR